MSLLSSGGYYDPWFYHIFSDNAYSEEEATFGYGDFRYLGCDVMYSPWEINHWELTTAQKMIAFRFAMSIENAEIIEVCF